MARDQRPVHQPVLVRAVLDALPAQLSGWIVDATVGAGGHAAAILERHPEARLLGLDQDEEVLDHAHLRLERFGERARLRCARVSELADVLQEEGIERPAVLLLDLGASSLQLDRPERGFSFQVDGPLDMRMDKSRTRTAADIVNRWDEDDLADLLFHEGGERASRAIAREIVRARRRVPFLRTAALAQLVAEVKGSSTGRLHPATQTFQALRRAVNEEGEELLAGLAAAEEVLPEGGRLIVISFHEGEDGAVKRFLREGAREARWELLGRKPVGPEAAERRANRRARSARLRAAVRTRPELGGRS